MSDHAWSSTFDASLPSCRGAHKEYMVQVLDALRDLGWEYRDLFGIEMALEESITNAIRHGNKLDPDKLVKVVCKISAERFWLQVRDEGEGFCPEEVPDCTAMENLETCSGRGVMLIRAFMNKVEYNPCGNCVTMEKERTDD
jgi:serine/threonine-protein kinase RsbW